MKRSTLTLLLFFLLLQPLFSQTEVVQTITEEIQQPEIERNIRFLASDELLGRDTGTHELDIAAKFIATWLQVYETDYVPGTSSYFQDVPFTQRSDPDEIRFSAGDSTWLKDTDLVLMDSYRGEAEGEVVFLEYATAEELQERDVKNKIVVTRAGLPGQATGQSIFRTAADKKQQAAEAGALGLVELYEPTALPWQRVVSFLSGGRMQLAGCNNGPAPSIPHLWIRSESPERIAYLSEVTNRTAVIAVKGEGPRTFTSRNVVGVIEGTDPVLKNEYILLAAHYDHVGVTDSHGTGTGEDTIYNGARDNAVGVAAIMSAVKHFASHPPKRSVVFAAWTAEEKGLLGSRYYAENPLIPLEQTIFNLNIDGAGYNDTSRVTIIGLNRTDAASRLTASAEAFGLEAHDDPAPEQNLFDRSDNVNFAARGIPAPTYSLGFTAFDEEINHYYHQVTDESDSLDFEYITRYVRSYVYAASLIANMEETPFWLPGDKYEEAGKQLYNH